MKTRGCVLLLLSLLALSCASAFERPINLSSLRGPEIFVLGVAGNDCYARKIREAFLFGAWSDLTCGGGPSSQILFPSAPSRWRRNRSPLSFRLTDNDRFFLDRATLKNGEDENLRHGAESAHLVFYMGHGNALGWTAWEGKDVELSDVSLGDRRTRYLWLLSCKVMAHGPRLQIPNGSPSETDNLAPQRFRPGTNHSNAFYRWTERQVGSSGERMPLNPRLRLACGGSTMIGGGTANPAGAVWHYKRFINLPVTDSFILGLKHGYHVPLCITRGGSKPEKTPLYDQDFIRNVNPAPKGSHLHIQYPVSPDGSEADLKASLREKFGFESESPAGPPDEPPPSLPVLTLEATPLPAKLDGLPWQTLPFQEYGFQGGAARLLVPATPSSGADLFPDWTVPLNLKDVCVRRQPKSGAVVSSWRPSQLPAGLDQHLLSPAGLTSLFTSLGLETSQWTAGRSVDTTIKPMMPKIERLVMRVDSAPQDRILDPTLQVDDSTKCLYIRLRSRLKVADQDVLIFGEGGEWLLAGCPRTDSLPVNDTDVCSRQVPPAFTISWVGRQVTDTETTKRVLRLAEARVKAEQQLRDMKSLEAYREVAHRWGYKAAPIHCSQEKMYLVYEFDYRARPGEQFENFAPLTIEVPGHDLGGGRIEDTWDCSPEIQG